MIITRSGFFKRGYNLSPASGGFAPPSIISSDFSSGVFSPFTFAGGAFTSGTIIDDPTGGGRGKVFENDYTNIGPASDRNSGAYLVTTGTQGPLPGEDLFFRGYIFFPSAGISRWTSAGQVLRKLTYCRDSVNGPGECDWVVGMRNDQLFADFSFPGTNNTNSNLATLSQDVWICLEWRIRKSSTNGANDGQWQMWVDGVEVLNQSGKNFDGLASTRWAWLNVGAQREGDPDDTGSDFDTRYWSNIAFSRSRIGP